MSQYYVHITYAVLQLLGMDRSDPGAVPVVALESLRIRLSQLVLTLSELSVQVQAAELPSWPAVHKQFDVAATQLEYLVSNLESFAPALQRAVAYPLPSFPTRTQGWLLTTLLRKKNLPEVDEWISRGVESGADISPDTDAAFCEFAMDTTKAHVRVGIEPLSFEPPNQTQGWSLDKFLAFMSGQDIQ